jgi:Icc-related predicted phosphoesterase
MKILALTDFGGEFPDSLFEKLKKEDFDFGVCSGDLASIKQLRDYFFKYGKGWEEKFSPEEVDRIRLKGVEKVKDICDKLETLNKPIYIVGGNNELIKYQRFKEILLDYQNCKLLEDEWVNNDKVNIFGYFNNEKISETNLPGRVDKNLNSKLKDYKENILLISHYPPFGCKLDKLSETNPVNPGKHVGSTKLRNALDKSNVSLVVCGHLEENKGEDKVNSTRILNPGSADKGNYSIIDFDEKLNDAKIYFK